MKELINKLIYDNEPFFDGEEFTIDLFKRNMILDKNAFPGTKLDIAIGVFESLNVNQFLLITGNFSVGNDKDMGKVALVFNNHELTENELENFSDMIYHRLPISIWLRCFIFLPFEYQKYIEYQNKL